MRRVNAPDNQRLRAQYDRAFYAVQIQGSARSAAMIVPRLLELFPGIRSVVDVGCGTGTWLRQFRRHGVARVVGVDGGDPGTGLRQIDSTDFLSRDLSQPIVLDETFDLVMCLEVAEHLPPACGSTLVASLARLGDVVIFSAAVPGQGGTNHVNERWLSYWVGLFRAEGFTCLDVLRRGLWYDGRVEWWYAQNMVVFVRDTRQDVIDALARRTPATTAPLDLVHPRCFALYRGLSPVPADDTEEVVPPPAALAARLQEVENSTSWRTMKIFQRLVVNRPRLRKVLRVMARILWRIAGERWTPADGA